MMDYVTKFVPREQYETVRAALERLIQVSQNKKYGPEYVDEARRELRKAEAMEIGPSK